MDPSSADQSAAKLKIAGVVSEPTNWTKETL